MKIMFFCETWDLQLYINDKMKLKPAELILDIS